MSEQNTHAVNPLPPVVVALFLVLVGVEVILYLGSKGIVGGPQAIGWRQQIVQQYGFSDRIFQWMLENRQYPSEHVMRLFTYQFVHTGFTHAVFSGVMVLAIGKMVGEVFAGWATMLIFLLSGIVGALVYGLVLDTPLWLIGAYPGIYGLIGAFTFLLWVRLGAVGAGQARAFTLIGFLLGIQLLFALVFGGSKDWVADVAGFITGFGMSFLLVPGGWAKIRALIRRE